MHYPVVQVMQVIIEQKNSCHEDNFQVFSGKHTLINVDDLHYGDEILNLPEAHTIIHHRH